MVGEGESTSATVVVLNVYDLTPVNNYTVWIGFGLFHSGIEVHGKEYGFGAHEFPASGVFEVGPRTCPRFIYLCSVSLGRINMPPTEFRTFIENMASEYHGDTYHLISKNCNHFSDDLSCRLTSRGIPRWVNRLARLGAVCSCLLPESLQLTAVKQLLEYHDFSDEDGAESLSTATPHESTEMDDTDQEKHLLSATLADGGLTFVKELRELVGGHVSLLCMIESSALHNIGASETDLGLFDLDLITRADT